MIITATTQKSPSLPQESWCSAYLDTHKVYSPAQEYLATMPKIIFLTLRDRQFYPTKQDQKKNVRVIKDKLTPGAKILVEVPAGSKIDRQALQLDFVNSDHQILGWDDPEARKKTNFKDEIDPRVARIEEYIINPRPNEEEKQQVADDLKFLESDFALTNLEKDFFETDDKNAFLDLIYERSIAVYLERVKQTALERTQSLLKVIKENQEASVLFVNIGLNHVYFDSLPGKTKKAPDWVKEYITLVSEGLEALNLSYVILKPKKYK